MFRTKKDIDKHVRSTLSKLRDDEKNLRGHRIATLYYNIGEYTSALEYIQSYIQSNDKNPEAYKLLGQCYEKFKRPDKQLMAYQRSLELDKKQTDLLIEVCKLMQNSELSDVTPAKARHWYELAESRNIHDPAVLNLKLKFSSDNNQAAVQDIILKEIARRPFNVGLRVRLIHYYLDQKRIDDAFKYVSDIQLTPLIEFHKSIDWNSTVSQVLDKYKEKYATTLLKNWSYWLLRITTIERQLFLALAHTSKDRSAIDHNLIEAANLLFELDQHLYKVATVCSFGASEKDLVPECLSHYRGQLSLHAATLIFKREIEKSFQGNWTDATKNALPLLLLAYNFGSFDANQMWLRNASETTKQLTSLWLAESSFRVSQAARTLQSCVSRNENGVLENLRRVCIDKYGIWSSGDDILKEIRNIVADSDWRKKLHRYLFQRKEHQKAASESYFVKSSAFDAPTLQWPDTEALKTIELKSQEADALNLAHLVYLALVDDFQPNAKQITVNPDFKCVLFNKLNVSVSNLMNCGAETLNQLDIDGFLYATTLQAKRNLTMENTLLTPGTPIPDANKPKILPYANMATHLCTDEQRDWWTAAYKIHNNDSGDDLGVLRATLECGIEAVRGIGAAKMDLIILLKLGQIFSKKAQSTSKAVERGFLEDRSESLFKQALDVFRKKTSGRTPGGTYFRLFKYTEGNNFFEIQQEEKALAEDAITFLASRYFSKNAFEDCAEVLNGIKLPFATYFSAESYRKMTEYADTPRKNKRAFLDKAKDYFKETLDLLDSPHVDKNHPLKSIVDEDLKRLNNETRKLETTQNLSDSFVSANGLDESNAHRMERDVNAMTTPVNTQNNNNNNFNNIERMIRQMMESLTLLKDDVAEVRSRVQNIEEQMLNKDDDIDIDGPLYDEYNLDDLRNHTRNLNNTSMMANVSRNQTINQHTPKSAQLMKAPHQLNAQPPMSAFQQSPMTMGNSYNPLMNAYGAVQPSPYLAGMAAAPNYGQTPQLGANFASPSMMGYQHDLQQLFIAQQLGIDPRNAGLLNLLQQSISPAQQQQPIVPQSYAMTNTPMAANAITSTVPPAQPATVNVPMKFDVNASPMTQTPPAQKQWNASTKNAPVEKGPPVNVVITSSDPVPQNVTTISTAPTTQFTVTIPPQHIKNNPAASAPIFSAAAANPTIFAALKGQISTTTTPSPSKPNVTPTSAAPTPQEQKSIFGSLSKGKAWPASSTPISSPDTKVTTNTSKTDAPKVEAAKPFASFSFGTQASSSTTTPAPAGNQTKAPFSFSNIGQSLNRTDTSSLVNASTPEAPSQSATNANTSAGSVHEDEDNRNFEPNVHFEPVIPLPDLVEVKTGEENEEILFEHRAKLLRYVKESKEWKERGIGNMKIMANKDDPNKVRLLMRRDQVLKICCNQMLTKDTKFNKMPNTETALTWFGQDYSENELQVEMLAIRFKTAEICKQFHDAVLNAQAKMTDGKAKSSTTNKASGAAPTTAAATEKKGFGDQFKPKAGSWSCEICYVVNQEAHKKCVSCGTAKDKDAPAENTSKSTAPKSSFSFGNLDSAMATPAPVPVSKSTEVKAAAQSLAEQFKPKPGTWECKACYSQNAADVKYCACCDGPKDDTVPKKEPTNAFSLCADKPKFSFGNLGAATQKPSTPFSTSTSTATTAASTEANAFGSSTFSFSFGGQNATPTKPKEPSMPKLDDSKEFGFVYKAKSPAQQSHGEKPGQFQFQSPGALNTDGVEDVSDDENVEEEENTTYFAPVIPLPDKVEVKSGEEDEDVLYSHRTKLFRFRDKEWRERGLGDIKILRHRQTGQLRVLMRRDQIHKICLNHLLTPDVTYSVKDPKSWQFYAMDFSDGEYVTDHFCLRFKNDEIAKEFKKAIDDARAGTTASKGSSNVASAGPSSNLSAEDSQNITWLELPGDFYDYKTKNEPCKGCRGCESDDYVFSEVKDTNFGQIDDNPLPLTPPPKVDISHNDLSKDTKKNPNPFSFGAFKTENNGFGATTNPISTQPSGMMFGSNSFKFTSPTEQKDTNNTSKTNLFGNSTIFGSSNANTVVDVKPSFSFSIPSTQASTEKSESKPLFGATPSFGGSTVIKSPSTNIFGGNTNGDHKPNDAPTTGFSFKLPSSTTLTPVTATKAAVTPVKTSTPVTDQSSAPAFGSPGGMSFADLAKNTNTNSSIPPSEQSNAPIFGSAGGMSFADLAKNTNTNSSSEATGNLSFSALAQQNSNGPAPFSKTPAAGGFVGLSNRDTFSNLMQPKNTVNGTAPNESKEDDHENAGDDANYDPHYEPIIALPDEIQVSTGEENEIKLFGERAKLYRYDDVNKEWKERGVGEFKILHHPGNESYRLLLRREQIHKLVLNMALNADLKVTPMKQSDKAFAWVGRNYAEKGDGETETLSVRFKYADLASQFNEVLQRCINTLKERQNQ